MYKEINSYRTTHKRAETSGMTLAYLWIKKEKKNYWHLAINLLIHLQWSISFFDKDEIFR